MWTAQHVDLYLMLFPSPAGRKTVHHVELYLVLFAWLIVAFFSAAGRSLSRSSTAKPWFLVFLPSGFRQSSTFTTWILHTHAHCERRTTYHTEMQPIYVYGPKAVGGPR